jgi:hypothetical protein
MSCAPASRERQQRRASAWYCPQLRSVADPGNFTEVDECCLTCGQAADVFSWLVLSRVVVRTQCGPFRLGGTGLGRALNTGS